MSLNDVFHHPSFPAIACQLCGFATQERGKHFFLTSEHINLVEFFSMTAEGCGIYAQD